MDNPTEPDDVPAESDHAETCAARLDQKLADLLAKVEASEVYRIMSDPQTDPLLVGAILKYSLLEVFSYGPHVTEATFTAIGRMPKTRPDLMKPMILHDIEEADHGEMALKDFVRLGGDEAWARSRRISPASYVLGATCRLLAQQESPFSYLGYMYLFETLTPILTARLLEILKVKGIRADAQYFVQFHSTEDISHSKALRGLVKRVVRDYPEAAEAIDYGYECFCCTYPLPVWDTALQNALAEVRR
jgi:hypothetical protein